MKRKCVNLKKEEKVKNHSWRQAIRLFWIKQYFIFNHPIILSKIKLDMDSKLILNPINNALLSQSIYFNKKYILL